jgi:hypothetical protein
MKKRSFFAAVITVITVVAGAEAQDRRVVSQAEGITGDRFTVSVRTQLGANVIAVRNPSAAMLAAIDAEHQHLSTEPLCDLRDERRPGHCRGVDTHLVGTLPEEAVYVADGAHTPADGQRN